MEHEEIDYSKSRCVKYRWFMHAVGVPMLSKQTLGRVPGVHRTTNMCSRHICYAGDGGIFSQVICQHLLVQGV